MRLNYLSASRSLVAGLAILTANGLAFADDFQPGTYDTYKGWGTLTISRESTSSAKKFTIITLGSNGSGCSVEGSIKGGKVLPETGADALACEIQFKRVGPSIEITSNEEQCRSLCGSSATFEGVYERSPEACRPTTQQKTRQSFLNDYQQKNYQRAYQTLSKLYSECQSNIFWMPLDQIRNDLAITLFHLGRSQDCRNILEKTFAAGYRDAGQLAGGLRQTDYNSYLPIAEATWHNAKRCRS